jgi:hypothetical protein
LGCQLGRLIYPSNNDLPKLVRVGITRRIGKKEREERQRKGRVRVIRYNAYLSIVDCQNVNILIVDKKCT